MLRFVAALFASLLPYRWWERLPPDWPVESAAFESGLLMIFAGAAVGIPGFLEHAAQGASLGTNAVLAQAAKGHEVAIGSAYNGLAIFTFLLLTPKGWATLYLMGTGTLRAAAAWFDDPIGDPVLTGIDEVLWRTRRRGRERRQREQRETLEGPEIADRVLTAAAAGLPDCDLVVVSSRRKDGWERGAVVVTNDACYRIGDPIERTVAGHLRTLYPLTEHRDLEAIRRPVHYEMPTRP